MADRSVMEALASYVNPPVRAVSDWWTDLNSFTHQADQEAEKRFPDQARDSSIKNAYRHALGTGRLAQLLGAGSGVPGLEAVARGAAKVAGYGWEGMGGMENWGSTDMRHDLNANAQGIEHTRQAKDFKSLADALESFSRSARKELPPNVLEPARGYFTYTK